MGAAEKRKEFSWDANRGSKNQPGNQECPGKHLGNGEKLEQGLWLNAHNSSLKCAVDYA
jgi:hypothetical protein